ncbi:MAG: BACON domain-containing protein [Prevotella sp.]|nr:BACON domain-containing protein [Prevotella sp.]
MKKILSLIVLLAGVTMFTSCSSDDATYTPTPKLEIGAADVLFEAEGGNGSITLNTSSAVTATTDADWLALSVSGNKVNVVANPNITLNGRSALIKLKAGETEATVTATQKSSIYGIPSLEYEIADYQASLDIDVVHNQTVTVESQADWLTAVFNEETSQIEIVAEDNNEADPREGIIKITMGQYTDEIVITQIGLLLKPEVEILKTTDDAASLTVSVSHSRTVTVKSNDDWITATWNARTNVLTCAVKANDTGWRRTGTVTLTSGPATQTVTISQFDFVKDVQGNYVFWYYNSGWQSMNVVLSATSSTEGTLTWKARYTTVDAPFVMPVTFDAATESFSIENWLDLEQKYSRSADNTVYTLSVYALTAYNNGLYRLPASYIPEITASLYEDEETGTIGFEFDGSYGQYEFYGLRIAYGTGGYDGYVGSFVTYPYCELEKQ